MRDHTAQPNRFNNPSLAMHTVFISSIIQGYEEMRQKARRAAELMDYKPITVETDLAA
jgi:hypothetical protein